MRFSYNEYAFQWSFPEIVASELQFFKEEGIDLDFSTFVPENSSRKNAIYNSLLKSGRSDLYHAAEWACIIRVAEESDTCIVAASPPGPGTLNSTFSIFALAGRGIKEPEDLANIRIAVENDTGSYFTAAQDVSRYVKRNQIRLVQVGGPHQRLVSLLSGEVEAASLIHPWTELATDLGLVEVLKTDRTNPTLAVVNRKTSLRELRSFFRGVNRAIERINAHPAMVQDSYSRRFLRICSGLPQRVKTAAERVRGTLTVPRWMPWRPYNQEDFARAMFFLEELGLAPANLEYRSLVHGEMEQIFK